MSTQPERSLLDYDSLVSSFWETPAGSSMKLVGDLAGGAYEWLVPALIGEDGKDTVEGVYGVINKMLGDAASVAGDVVYKTAINGGVHPETANWFKDTAGNIAGSIYDSNAPFFGGMFNSVVQVLMSGPAAKLYENQQLAEFRPNILSPYDLWQYKMRGYGDDSFEAYAKYSGYSDDQLEVIKHNYYNSATLELIQLGKAWYGWDGAKVDKLLHHMGYPLGNEGEEAKNILSAARLATEQPMGMNDAFELERRGKLDKGVLQKNLSLLGFEKHYRDWLENLVERTPDPNMVRELIRRGKLDGERGKELVSWLGWPEDIQEKWPDLIRTVLSPFEYREHFLRGYLSEAQFREGLKANGILDIDQTNFINASFTPPTPSDLVRMGVREVFTPDVVKEFDLFDEFPQQIVPWGRKVGLSEEVLKFHWAAHWDLPSPTQGYDMFHRGVINRDQLELLLRTKDYMPYWRGKLMDISYNLIPWRLILRLAQSGVFSVNDAKGHFKKLGYTEEDSSSLGKYIADEYKIQYEWPTVNQVIELYAIGEATQNDVKTILDLLGYKGAKRKYYERIAEEKKNAQGSVSGSIDSPRDVSSAKTSAKTKVLEGVRKGTIDKGEGKGMLLDLGYSEDAASFYILSAELDRDIWVQEKIYKLTEEQYMSGVITRAKAIAELGEAGYSIHNSEEVVNLWEKEKESKERIKRENPRLPTKADLRDWLELGIIQTEIWVEYMEKLGYSEQVSLYYLTEILVNMEGE